MVRTWRSVDLERRRNTVTGVKVKNSKKKEKRFRLTQRQVLLVAFILILFMGGGIGYVWSNFEGTQIGYDLSRLQKEELALLEMNQKLRLELATYRSPQYLEKAIRRLGLREAKPEEIVVLP